MNLGEASTMGNHNNQTELRASTMEAILLVVVEIKDGSPTRPLVPGHVSQVSVVNTISAFQ